MGEQYCNIIYNGPDYVKKQIMVSNKKEDIPTDTRGNEKIFNNKSMHFDQACNMIFSVIQLSGFKSKGSMSNFVHELSILKAFSINIHPCKAKYIKEVLWRAPQLGTIKCNIDGFAHGSPGHVGSGGIFRDHWGGMPGCFSSYIGIQNSLFAKICAIILALEVAKDKGWLNLWIEYDSVLVIQAFSNPSIVLVLSHIYREGNFCADKLANGVVLCLMISSLGGTRFPFLLGTSFLEIKCLFQITSFTSHVALGYFPP
ncbi:putative ribonuclease H protein [Glycine soja]